MHDMSASSMLVHGLELEDAQYASRLVSIYILLTIALSSFRRSFNSLVKTSKANPGTVEAAVIEERRTTLARKINHWRVIQSIYMPVVALIAPPDATPSEHVHLQDLHFPSSLTQVQRNSLNPVHGLLMKEWRLRNAQAEDSIATVKRILAVRKKVYGFKASNLVGQRDGTRA